jgi:glutaminase
MVTGATADAVWAKIIGIHNDMAGRPLTVLQDVYKSESDSNQRNQAIGALMLAYGYIKSNWQQAGRPLHPSVLDWRECEGPRHDGGDAGLRRQESRHGQAVIDAAKVPGVLAIMATAGLYDDSASGSTTRACRPRAASAAASSPSHRASSASR